NLALVLEARELGEVRPEAPTEHLGELGVRRLRERTQRLDPALLEALGRLRADARHEPRRLRAEALERHLAAEHHEAVGLVRVRGHLRDQLVRSDADRAAEPRPLLD